MLNITEEQVNFLTREVPIQEIIGRRCFIMLVNNYPKIMLVKEPKTWNNYIIHLSNYKISFKDYATTSSVHYNYNHINNTLSLVFEDNCSFIDARNLVIHILNEVNKWQKRQKK